MREQIILSQNIDLSEEEKMKLNHHRNDSETYIENEQNLEEVNQNETQDQLMMNSTTNIRQIGNKSGYLKNFNEKENQYQVCDQILQESTNQNNQENLPKYKYQQRTRMNGICFSLGDYLTNDGQDFHVYDDKLYLQEQLIEEQNLMIEKNTQLINQFKEDLLVSRNEKKELNQLIITQQQQLQTYLNNMHSNIQQLTACEEVIAEQQEQLSTKTVALTSLKDFNQNLHDELTQLKEVNSTLQQKERELNLTITMQRDCFEKEMNKTIENEITKGKQDIENMQKKRIKELEKELSSLVLQLQETKEELEKIKDYKLKIEVQTSQTTQIVENLNIKIKKQQDFMDRQTQQIESLNIQNNQQGIELSEKNEWIVYHNQILVQKSEQMIFQTNQIMQQHSQIKQLHSDIDVQRSEINCLHQQINIQLKDIQSLTEAIQSFQNLLISKDSELDLIINQQQTTLGENKSKQQEQLNIIQNNNHHQIETNFNIKTIKNRQTSKENENQHSFNKQLSIQISQIDQQLEFNKSSPSSSIQAILQPLISSSNLEQVDFKQQYQELKSMLDAQDFTFTLNKYAQKVNFYIHSSLIHIQSIQGGQIFYSFYFKDTTNLIQCSQMVFRIIIKLFEVPLNFFFKIYIN